MNRKTYKKNTSIKIFLLLFFLSFAFVAFIYLQNSKINKRTNNINEPVSKINNNQQSSLENPIFEYLNPIDKSKLKLAEVGAWKVNVRTNLLTNNNVNKITLNLFDGFNYEVTRKESSTCNTNTKCIWTGYISSSNKVTNKLTGENHPAETVIFVIDGNSIAGSVPAVLGVNQYSYKITGMLNDPGPILFKLDPSKFPQD